MAQLFDSPSMGVQSVLNMVVSGPSNDRTNDRREKASNSHDELIECHRPD